MAALPWSVSSGAQVDVKRAAEILDEDHYDLEKVKDRILDYLAVLQLRPVVKGPILCFVGPPGSGQDIARQIDRAGAGPQVRAHLDGRHARRGGDPRPPAHLHRSAARADHAGAAAGGRQRSGFHAGRGGQAGPRFPRRSGIGAARSAGSGTERRPSATTIWTCRSTSRRSCSSPPPTCSIRFPTPCATAWRSFRSRATPSRKR